MEIVLNIKQSAFEKMKRVVKCWLGRMKKQSEYTVLLSESQVITFLLGVGVKTLEIKMREEKRERRRKKSREWHRKKTEND